MNFKELVRLGKDAEIRHTSNAKMVVGFSAAYDNGWGDKKQTIWLDCSAWGERFGKVAEYLTKGSQVVVSGNIGTREYESKTYITLDVQDIQLVAKSGDRSQRQESGDQSAPSRRPTGSDLPLQRQAPPADDFADDRIPF